MADFDQFLINREKDAIPISVGTAMAIQALKENTRYDSIWINVRTLYRNILGSMPTDVRNIFIENPEEAALPIARVLSQETEVIRNYLNGRIDGVRLYLLGYTDLKRKFPNAMLKIPATPKQKGYMNLMESVVDKVMAADYDQQIRWDKGTELEGEYGRSVIITSYPVDLLSRTKFRELRLLESHTGAIKPKSQWYTKLSDGKQLSNIPFNRFTIQIFGDGPLQFERFSVRFRKEIVNLAATNRWTPVTTMDRIRFSLGQMRDRFSAEQLKKLL